MTALEILKVIGCTTEIHKEDVLSFSYQIASNSLANTVSAYFSVTLMQGAVAGQISVSKGRILSIIDDTRNLKFGRNINKPFFYTPTISEIMTKHNLSCKGLSEKFNIPYRTVQNWIANGQNHRTCPEYVRSLILANLSLNGEGILDR